MSASIDRVASAGRRSHHPLCAVAAVLIGSFLVGFQTRLFSIGLNDVKGAFGLSFDEGAWLSTAATAPQIFIAPMVVWLAVTFGVRRVLGGPSLLFSVVCLVIPFVRNYEMLVALHVVQGLLLGLFIPATILIILRNLPQPWWLPAIAIYAFRSAFTTNYGVSLVGSYVQSLGWEWLYWQGAVLAPLMGLLAYFGAPKEPISRTVLLGADWGGMLLLGSGLALLYVGLDQGNRLDWQASGLVVATLAGGAALVVSFLLNEFIVKEPWADVKVLLSRNVVLLFMTTALYMVTSLSNSLLIPNFLSAIGGLRPEQMAPLLVDYVALPLFLLTIVAVIFLRRFDARIALTIGLTAFALAAWVATGLTSQWRLEDFIPIAVLQSIGHGFTFIAIIIFAFSNLNSAKAVAFAAYIQVLRLGSAEAGLAVVNTWLRVREQIHSNYLVQHIAMGDASVVLRLAQLKNRFMPANAGLSSMRGVSSLATSVQKEANVLAYIDGFWLAFIAALLALVLVALMKAPPPGPFTPKKRTRRVSLGRRASDM
jgi:DHA2 family multidrug resistance protein